MIKNKFAKENLQSFKNNKDVICDIFIILGEMNKEIINSAISIITNKLSLLEYTKSTIKKAKHISIELLENITKHQSGNSFDPYFELSISPESMRFTTGNCVSKEDFEKLDGKLKEYGSLPPEEIKEKYYYALSNNDLDTEGNAGLGLLTLMNRCKKKYNYKMNQISDTEYFFNSTVEIGCKR